MNRNLEKIAQLTAHIRDLLENTDVRETWTQAHGLTLMIDGLLVAEGLEIKLPDYGLDKAINEPEYEVAARSNVTRELTDGEILEALYHSFHFDHMDIDVLMHSINSANRNLQFLYEKVQNAQESDELDHWLSHAYERWYEEHEAEAVSSIKPAEEDTKEIEKILNNVE